MQKYECDTGKKKITGIIVGYTKSGLPIFRADAFPYVKGWSCADVVVTEKMIKLINF